MHTYGWMKTQETQAPITAEATKRFRLSQAAYADEQAVYWAKEGDKTQAARWAAEAEDLRKEAAA